VLEKLGMVVVGDPDHCLRRFQALKDAGVNHVLCAIGAGVVPTREVRESMRIVAERILPHFQTP
jgi:alkanesulfonate monooxygenase SsuD/methylene tetrahydromethanopterin reductase-like flavin-dependent oxidoreductase (luciferase family)